MSESVVTKARWKDANGEIIAERTATTNCPRVLQSDATLQELVEALGEDYVRQKVQAQLIIDFRGKVRTQLSKLDDNGEYAIDVSEIESEDYSDWTPELKQRKSAEEKAAEVIGKLSPDQLEAVRAKVGF